MNGILNVLKPPGMTSQNVVSFMRRATGIKKIGHSGTLDPYAAGVLPLFIGKATRVVEYAMAGEKEYIGEICFGLETDTLDAQGQVTARCDKRITQCQFQQVLTQTKGIIYQRPPMYSALKKDGQKLVDLARKGKQVEIPPRPVEIFETELIGPSGPNRFLFRVRCSKGTYVRTLCQDWGKQLDTVAYLGFLLRTKTGNYRIEDSFTLEEITSICEKKALQNVLQPIYTGCAELPRIELKKEAKHAVLCGQEIISNWILAVPAHKDVPCQLWVDGQFMGIAQHDGRGTIKTQKVIWEELCNAYQK